MIFVRYLRWQLWGGIGGVWAALAALFLFFRLLDELEDAPFAAAMSASLAHLPRIALETLPFAAALAAAAVFSLAAARREVAVMLTAGMSLARLSLAAALATGVFVLLFIAISEWALPPAAKWQRQQAGGGGVHPVARDLWLRDGAAFVKIGRVGANPSEIEDIVIYDVEEASGGGRRLRAIVEARSAFYEADGWVLRDGREIVLENERRVDDEFDERAWRPALTPSALKVFSAKPRAMAAGELAAAAAHLRANRQHGGAFEEALWGRAAALMSLPLFAAAGALFAATVHRRALNMGAALLAAFLLAGAYRLLSWVSANLADAWGAPPAMAALLPAVLLTLMLFALLRRRERPS